MQMQRGASRSPAFFIGIIRHVDIIIYSMINMVLVKVGDVKAVNIVMPKGFDGTCPV
jgi:hypothetical protein